jgi:selenide,water dikinase
MLGAEMFDDAGIYRLRADCALVQTVDFFTPVVDDPFTYGQIAAANALSDVYAMGGRPISALNLLGMPADQVPARVISQILRGGALKAKEAGCAIIGGHSIRNPEPIYGLSVTGIVHPKRVLTNASARAGDVLVLTKPLGTGIATTGIKQGLTSPALARRAIAMMSRLNAVGADLAEAGLIKSATDVTGFGLIGHLGHIVRASELTAEIVAGDVPAISNEVDQLIRRGCIPGGTRANMEASERMVDWGNASERDRVLLCDAQTSGGLLLCVPARNLSRVMALLRRAQTPISAVIGKMHRGKARIIVNV